MTDGGRRDAIQRSVFEHIKSNFKFMVAVGVGTEVEDEELRKLSTRGRSLHIQNFDGKYCHTFKTYKFSNPTLIYLFV